ncbi:cytochrome P450 [Streptomyces sp. NPDC059679]|uniref:cytochrome P450 family protein n=1 Tax=Streptomyces sp. NPDC059679 TaxID=3346903 RepID=UPI0036BAAF66
MTPEKPGRCPISLNDPELTADPYHGFGRIREEAPVALGSLADGRNIWIVTRYDDVHAVLTDERFVSNSQSVPGTTTNRHAESLTWLGLSEELLPLLTRAITQLDPPHHTRLRELVAGSFSARVPALLPRVRALADELVDALPVHAVDGTGTVDLVEHFADPLPIAVVCELLGVPAEDRARWRKWSHDYADILRLKNMLTESGGYLRELVRRRRAEPADDLITGLMAQGAEGERLSDTEVVTMAFHLIVAAHETTAGLIGNGVLALLTHPGQLALLANEPQRMPEAVQELLRWCSPMVFGKPRYATEGIRVADTPIGKGDVVLPVQGAANHDPRHFPEPERLDITRRPDGEGGRHLAYSRGPHHCLGATLADHEAEIALGTLFGRFPQLELAVAEEELAWRPVPGTRQLVRLPVRLGAEAAGPGRRA